MLRKNNNYDKNHRALMQVSCDLNLIDLFCFLRIHIVHNSTYYSENQEFTSWNKIT